MLVSALHHSFLHFSPFPISASLFSCVRSQIWWLLKSEKPNSRTSKLHQCGFNCILCKGNLLVNVFERNSFSNPQQTLVLWPSKEARHHWITRRANWTRIRHSCSAAILSNIGYMIVSQFYSFIPAAGEMKWWGIKAMRLNCPSDIFQPNFHCQFVPVQHLAVWTEHIILSLSVMGLIITQAQPKFAEEAITIKIPGLYSQKEHAWYRSRSIRLLWTFSRKTVIFKLNSLSTIILSWKPFLLKLLVTSILGMWQRSYSLSIP